MTSRQAWIEYKSAELIHGGKKPAQAIAIAVAMWEAVHGKGN